MKLRGKTATQRLDYLQDFLSSEDIVTLKSTIYDDLALADTLIENAVGYFAMPLALASGITINDRLYPMIPLAVEETSIVAALSKNISFVKSQGTIRACQQGERLIGQIHIPLLQNPDLFVKRLLENKESLISLANLNPCATMVLRGGGVQDITIRTLPRPDGKIMGIIHVLVDTKDAMGANIINQTCEYLRPLIEEVTGETILMCILSNFNTEKLTRIEIVLDGVEEALAHRIAEASLIAQCDPYRAVTHNKGIMNGMDAICIATGNDWRALEAGAHAFAVQEGQYRGLSQWVVSQGSAKGQHLVQLTGTLLAPISVGTIGGVTRIHPIASLALRCLGVSNAMELAYVIGAVGLIQNFGALRALVTEGITKGHMRLHLVNLIKNTDTTPCEYTTVFNQLNDQLCEKRYVTVSDVHQLLKKIRG